jgi:Fructosamine kinase
MLRSAVDSGHLPLDLAAEVEQRVRGMPVLAGPEPRPSLLHGDAQQSNFVSTPAGAVVIDPAPYFGHPEIDLALIDYFHPVPDEVFDAYREITRIDSGLAQWRELWRVFGYLAVVTVNGDKSSDADSSHASPTPFTPTDSRSQIGGRPRSATPAVQLVDLRCVAATAHLSRRCDLDPGGDGVRP